MLDANDYPNLGEDAEDLVRQLGTALWALGRMREQAWKLDGERDPGTLDEISSAIRDVTEGLVPRVEGIGRALMRQFLEAGASYGELAAAMNTARSTAQYRAEKLIKQAPSVWEQWAEQPPEEPQDFGPPLDPTLPEGLVIRWGQETVREMLRETGVLTRRHGQWTVNPADRWEPLTATEYHLEDGSIGSPEESRILFRTADDRWVIRDPQISTPFQRMKFYWASSGEALRFLESAGAMASIARHFPQGSN